VNATVPLIERWCFSRAWGTPFAVTTTAEHGAGWPLYLSLGYVSNPFNIGWRDPIGQLHARLIANLGYGDPAFQSTLLREFQQIVVTRPWLLIRNVSAKAARVHALASGSISTSVETPVTQSRPLVLCYRAVPFVMLGSLLLLAWRGTVEGI